MTAYDQTTSAAPPPQGPLQKQRGRLRALARTLLVRFAGPYARARAGRSDLDARIARLEGELVHVRERHDEQLERLEDLARELVLAGEALRRRLSDAEARAGGAARRADAER